jgi:predicted MPP superfamily phosphohydrolase
MELRRLKAALGVYACLGNHDVDRFPGESGENTGTAQIRGLLEKAGVIVLQDEALLVADNFYIIGRRDTRPIGLNEERKPAAEITAGLDRSRALFFLNHQPSDFREDEVAGADLVLAGHSHKGQFFPGNLFTVNIFRNAGATHYGYMKGRSAHLLVTSGAGVWGPPLRIASNSEVAVIDISMEN